jgi:hypothetical protein
MALNPADVAIVAGYAALVARDMPDFARAYEQMRRIRAGDAVECRTYDPSAKYTKADFAFGLTEHVPDKYIALTGERVRRRRAKPCNAFQHVQSLVEALGADFPWHVPGQAAGFVLAGSFATPHFGAYRSVDVNLWTKDDRDVWTESTKVVKIPVDRGDIDLFIVAGTPDGHVLHDQSAEHLVRTLLEVSGRNPFMRTGDRGICPRCHKLSPFKCADDCPACSPNRWKEWRAEKYTGKHVVAYELGRGLEVQCVTRLYRSPELVPTLFDLQYDGFVFSPAIGVRALDSALYMLTHDTLVVTPFSGSATKALRTLKKVTGYKCDLVVPGLRADWRASAHIGGVASMADALDYHNVFRAALDYPIDPVEAIETSKRVLGDAYARHHGLAVAAIAKRNRGHCAPIGLASIVKYCLGEALPNGYSFVPGCRGIKIAAKDTDVILLLPDGRTELVGAFCYENPARYAEQMEMAFPVPKPERLAPATSARDIKRASAAFGKYLEQTIRTFDMAACPGVQHVWAKPGDAGTELIVAFQFELDAGQAAQIWSIRFALDLQSAPRLTCVEDTGLYATGAPVCMGGQSHYHADQYKGFSLESFVLSARERVALIMDRDAEHVRSLGVEYCGDRARVRACHSAALRKVGEHEWLVRWSA